MTGYSFTTPVWDGGTWVTPVVAEARAAPKVNGPKDVLDWDAISWQVHEGNVRRLRQRIFKAAREQDGAKVRSLQKMMLRSWSNTLVSVRQVEQLLQPLPLLRPILQQLQPGVGQVTQRPDLRRRHERGPQQAHLGEPSDRLRVLLAGLRPPGQLPRMPRVHQLHVQPGRLQHVVPDPPVIDVDSMTTTSTPSAISRLASARTSRMVAVTVSTRDARRLPHGPAAAGWHTAAFAFATSIPATRS
jgi:hypothetical protein